MVAEVMGASEIGQRLSELDGWISANGAITRTVEMLSFPEAIALVDRVAVAAEEMDHHPDMDIRWRTVTFSCVTHSAGGVTARDFRLATRIDEILKGFTGGN